ncbi:carbonic anhydrase [Dehalococcoides sp.]|jgi:carbonic anhydrase|uniref:carbonic anhydrase n=1 Tax=Dehalococcoides sp. TaxID=1966486 RepID=UPI0035649702
MKIVKITDASQIPSECTDTPIAELIEYQNLGKELHTCHSAHLLIGMCMDNRKQLRIPENFAYILRTGGANLRNSEFKVSYAIAIGEVKHIALIAHNNCGMVNLASKKAQFIQGLCKNAGWSRERAEEHFMNYAPMFEIDNEAEFVVAEAKRLADKYPGIMVVPLYYSLDDNLLSLILD